MAPSPEMAAVADQLVAAARMQFGPSPLPYANAARWMIRHHLLSLSDIFPAFRAALSPFVHDDGRSAVLLHVHGPIPAYIPISVWLVDAYPYVPPLVHLSPPSGTAIADKHPFVDPFGTVFSHYNLSWTLPSSNLVDLVRDLSVLFAVHPPLVASYSPKDDVVAKILCDLDAGKADAEQLLTDGYLRSVRELAREQFFFRFTSRRAREAREVERCSAGRSDEIVNLWDCCAERAISCFASGNRINS